MEQGRHSGMKNLKIVQIQVSSENCSRRAIKKKISVTKDMVFVLALSLLLLSAVGISATVAYINYSSQAVDNSFAASDISSTVEEKVSGGVKSSVKIKNTGKTAAYIRVAVIANTVNSSGQVTGAADVSSYLNGAGWVKSGMYYYYTTPIQPNGKTGEMLSSSINLSGIQVAILAEAIQSQPDDAVLSAWGVNPSTLGSK